MASLPSPTQVAGSHYQIYEAYYQQVDPNNQGTIGALEAARFLKKSKLSDIVLGKIWDLSDPAGKGCLNKQGFFVALKLCALAQAGRGISMDNITTDVPHPKMGDIPKIPPNKVVNSGIDWSIKPAEKAKYEQLFESLQPTNGVISGNRVRGVLMESKLPLEMLGKIWDLADLDKDGSLNRHEFTIAMHLVYKALEKHTIPSTLPAELMPPGKRKDSTISQSNLIMTPPKPAIPPQPSIPPLPTLPPQPSRPPLPPQPLIQPSLTSPILNQTLIITQKPSGISPSPVPLVTATNWVVSAEDKAKADTLFHQTDADKDGYVSGLEIKDVFLQSGVPQPVLAHIWSLCDTKQTGKLNNEQFALAMWLINQKVKGIEPPKTLTPDMVPPSLRSKPEGQVEIMPVVATYSNPELEMIAADIRELSREKSTLETDISQKEADIKIKSGEVKSLQSELDTLAATLKQLENQKGEAQKRLNDLKSQKSSIELELSDLVLEVESEQTLVDKLRHQAEEQEESLKTQESELSSKKQELEGLKQEEARLEKLQNENKAILENLAKKLQDSQLQISQVKAKITQLEELQRQMNDAIAICESATAANDPSIVPDSSLSLGADFRDPEITKLTIINEENDNTFSNMNGTSGFDDDSAFPNDAFSCKSGADGFGGQDPFSSAFGPADKPASDDFADPFSAFGAPAVNVAKNDPFDPFGDGTGRSGAKTPIDMSDKDPFGCDPFANLHAPERPTNPPTRPESPSPALPPKKSKQPPPRPAPPRPMQPNRAAPVPPVPSPEPTSLSSNDPFGGSGGFANFANFDSKLNKQETNSTLGGLRTGITLPAHQEKSISPISSTNQGRYAAFEFTEDPFKNYRYDDLFNIVDPFEEDNTNAAKASDSSAPGKVGSFAFQSDELAYETPVGNDAESFEAKFPKIDAFDSVFSFESDPFANEVSKEDKVNGNAVNIFSIKKNDSSEKSLNHKNSDPFELGKNLGTKLNHTVTADEFFNKDKCQTSIGKSLPGEDDQLLWAEQESLKMEEERLKQEAQEKADLEYAIAVSKKDSSTLNRDKGRIRNLLRFGRNTPAT